MKRSDKILHVIFYKAALIPIAASLSEGLLLLNFALRPGLDRIAFGQEKSLSVIHGIRKVLT